MGITGIICEYNPLHLGHKKQLDMVRRADPEGSIVCLMSGNYVQRGKPAIVDKSLRAKAAILSGADLVLELPIPAALSSAEGFASEGVRILGGFCDRLCFGAETPDAACFMATARALLSEQFSQALADQLSKGLSFPAARQAALLAMGHSSVPLSNPNDILATEYCKAILSQNSPMVPMPILRQGNYHSTAADEENPSATAVRAMMLQSGLWLDYVPRETRCCFENIPLHALHFGERSVLAKLRTMTDGDFEALPYGSEGLWRKLMHNCRKFSTLEEILTATKSKRYTRTRLNRMVLCAFLGITEADLQAPSPYVRVLAFNDRGRGILKKARLSGRFLNAGEAFDHPYWELEKRAGNLYGLFSADSPECPGTEEARRVFYLQN